MAKMLRSKLFGYINNLDQDMQHSRVLKKTDTCTMWQVHDRFAGMEYVECWGQFDNGYYFLIRSPLESIKESASIKAGQVMRLMYLAITLTKCPENLRARSQS